MVLVRGKSSDLLVAMAGKFLKYMKEELFDDIWNDMMTYRAKDLISHSIMPIHFLEGGDFAQLLDFDQVKGMALAFQMDYDSQRTALFRGFAASFVENHWYDLSHSDWMVFAVDDAAVAINGSRNKAIIVPFIVVSQGEYVIDWEAYFTFSMYLSSSKLFEIGTRALVYGYQSTANLFFEYSAQLIRPLERLDQLVLSQVLVQRYVTDDRNAELRAQRTHSERARLQIGSTIRATHLQSRSVDIVHFLSQHFKHYVDSADEMVTDTDLQKLDLMSDSKLRKAIAEILVGVDKHQARREAGKPHGPAELADMVVDVTFDGDSYSLCMPFKTGREMKRQQTVPESVIYQIWRPLMFLTNSVVVFITARPCSQYLQQDIRQSRDRMKWPIAVIEYEALARLLKANGKL